MKLKTLKDLTEYYLGLKTLVVAKDELKQEAIKWVKDCQDKIFATGRQLGTTKRNVLKIWEYIGASNILMDFFNITEEDIK